MPQNQIVEVRMREQFEAHLRKGGLSGNTITSYMWTVDYYLSHYDGMNTENLLAYKGYETKQREDFLQQYGHICL